MYHVLKLICTLLASLMYLSNIFGQVQPVHNTIRETAKYAKELEKKLLIPKVSSINQVQIQNLLSLGKQSLDTLLTINGELNVLNAVKSDLFGEVKGSRLN